MKARMCSVRSAVIAALLFFVPAMGVTLNYGVAPYQNVTASTTAGSGDVVISAQPQGIQQFEAAQVVWIAGVKGFKIVDSITETGNPSTVSTMLHLLNDDRTPFAADSTASNLAIRLIGDQLDHASVRLWATTDQNACLSFWFDVAPHSAGPEYRYRSGETNCTWTVSAVAVVGLAPNTKYYFRANVKTAPGTDNSSACNTDPCNAAEFTLTTPFDPHGADGRPPMPQLPEPVAPQVTAPLDTSAYEVIPIPPYPDGAAKGSITAGSKTMTVSTAPAGMAAGQWIVIEGVKCPGQGLGPLAPWCHIQTINGTMITLEHPADATVNNAPVSYGLYTLQNLLYSRNKSYGTVFEFQQGYRARWWPTEGGWSREPLRIPGLPTDDNPACAAHPCSIDDPAHRWIVFRTAAKPGNLPPPGVRTGPDFEPLLGGIQTQGNSGSIRLSGDGENSMPSHHIRIENLAFVPVATNRNDADPAPAPNGVEMTVGTSHLQKYVVLDRVYISPPDVYTRVGTPALWAGRHVAMVNSYVRGDYWRPFLMHYGPNATTDRPTTMPGDNTIRISGMQWQRNKFEPLVNQGPATVTATGSATGAVAIYGVMDASDPSGLRIRYTSGQGITMSCPQCGGVAALPDPTPAATQKILFAAAVAAGSNVISCQRWCDGKSASAPDSAWITEGVDGVLAAYGDHWLFENNYIESYSKGWFVDVPLILGFPAPKHVTIRRNKFYWNQDHRKNSPVTNGFTYAVRHNGIEFKRGTRALIEGNEFEGGWARVNHGPAVLFSQTQYPGNQPIVTRIEDMTVRYNLFHTQSEIFNIAGHQFAVSAMGADAARIYFGGNLIYDQNAFVQQESPAPAFFGRQGVYGGHDITVEHNTWYDSKGNLPLFDVGGEDRREGLWVVNNMWHLNRSPGGNFAFSTAPADNGTLIMSPPAVVTVGGTNAPPFEAALNSFTVRMAESIVPSYNFSNNVIVCGSQLVDGLRSDEDLSQDACDGYRDSFGGFAQVNYFPKGKSKSAREAAVGWTDPAARNFELTPDSPYAAGKNRSTDGRDIGVSIPLLRVALGEVNGDTRKEVSSDSATITATVADPAAVCSLAYGTNDAPGSWALAAQSADTATGNQRTFVLQGLEGGATYNYQVWCAGMPRTGTYQFTTQTAASPQQRRRK